MNILIIGGKLQGTEIAYLSKKAGWTVHLVDKNPMVAAVNLCDYFYQENLFHEKAMLELFDKVDVVIPALEDECSLKAIERYGSISGTDVICDLHAFHISSSKLRSNEFLKENDIPIPRDYRTCIAYDLPVVVKPSESSGSEGVQVFKKASEAEDFMSAHPDYICQEYLEGPSYSIEVIGNGEHFQELIITEIIVDERYDCQRVVAPAIVDTKIEKEFRTLAVKIAKALKINGIFDIEVIKSNNKLYVLEIDARMPSQTPIAIYHATGINMVKEVVEYTTIKPREIHPSRWGHSILQHVELRENDLLGSGEHIMGSVGPLVHRLNYFEADEALISDPKIHKGYVAELIVSSNISESAQIQMERSIKLIEEQFQTGEDGYDATKRRQHAIY